MDNDSNQIGKKYSKNSSNNDGFISDDNLTSTCKILSLLPHFLSITVVTSFLFSWTSFLSWNKGIDLFILSLLAFMLITSIINLIPFFIIWNPKGEIAQKLTYAEKFKLSFILAIIMLFFNGSLVLVIANIIMRGIISRKLQPNGFYSNILKKGSIKLTIIYIICFIITEIWGYILLGIFYEPPINILI